MGRPDEQHPQSSRRNRPERPDLQLNTRKDIASASENEAGAIFLFIFQKYVPFWTSNVPVTVVEQQFRKWGLYFQDKCCGIGAEDSSFPVLRFAQKNMRYRFKETFLKSVTVFASKTCGRGVRTFLEKVSENASFFGFESCGIGLRGNFFKNRVVFQLQKLL